VLTAFLDTMDTAENQSPADAAQVLTQLRGECVSVRTFAHADVFNGRFPQCKDGGDGEPGRLPIANILVRQQEM
jgi:hypothetical protein